MNSILFFGGFIFECCRRFSGSIFTVPLFSSQIHAAIFEEICSWQPLFHAFFGTICILCLSLSFFNRSIGLWPPSPRTLPVYEQNHCLFFVHARAAHLFSSATALTAKPHCSNFASKTLTLHTAISTTQWHPRTPSNKYYEILRIFTLQIQEWVQPHG